MKEPLRQRSWTHPAVAPAAVLALGLVLALAGCGDSPGDPVARLAVEPGSLELPYGAYADVGFRWTPLVEVEGSPRVFVHLVDGDGELVRTFDHDLTGGWHVGRESSYRARIYQSLLAPPLPPGSYVLTAGIYDPSDGERWPVETMGEEAGRSEYRIATVEVPERSEGAPLVPGIHFTEVWSPTLAGNDRQVIAYRWLTEEGTIRLDELQSRGTVWLALGVPAEVAGDMRRRIVDPPDGGDGVPRVEVTATCSDFAAQVSGQGTHGVEVPVEPAPDGCEIALDPNFVLESPSGDRRSLTLEVLAWNPAGS